jgi:hypothetical protein
MVDIMCPIPPVGIEGGCFPSSLNLKGVGDRYPCLSPVPTALMMMYCKSREIMTASIGIISHLRFFCHPFFSIFNEKKSRDM